MAKAKTPETPETRLSKALAHPLRVRILKEMNGHQRSPNELSILLDEPLGNVSYHVKALLGFECVELVGTEPRRGAVEHFYRATGAAIIDGITLGPLEAQMAGAAIKHSLSATSLSSDDMDQAERTEAERQELGKLADRLSKTGQS